MSWTHIHASNTISDIVDNQDAIGWGGIGALLVAIFMLLTSAVLPKTLTTHHYFTTNALVGFSLMSVGQTLNGGEAQ